MVAAIISKHNVMATKAKWGEDMEMDFCLIYGPYEYEPCQKQRAKTENCSVSCVFFECLFSVCLFRI